MFPIRNIKGDCIAFGGRLLSDRENQAKYLNSPETKLYKKKYELYGLYEVRQNNKRPESIFVVEGYMDVISLHQHGIKNAVASSGTAFTQEQLRKILNYTNTIYIVFDGDEAGLKASWRTVENAMPILREDTRINFIFLEDGEDPDSYVKNNGKEAFFNLAKNSKSLSDYFFETIKSYDDLSSIEGRTSVSKFALPFIKSISNETLKQAYINEVSKVCNIDFAKLIEGKQSNNARAIPSDEKVKADSKSILKKAVMGIFSSLIQYPELSKSNLFNLIKSDSNFSFLLEIKEIFINNPDLSNSLILDKIKNEKIRNVFGEVLVSEIKMTESDAQTMMKDCIELICQSYSEREELLREKYTMHELSSSEKRELQQIILKKAKMSQEDKALIKKLSST